MADAVTISTSTSEPTHSARSEVRLNIQGPPITPGKVAIWLFLATEVMFFTGLIGTYIVLRAGSSPTAYSNLYPPGTDLSLIEGVKPEGLVTASWPRPFDPSMNPLGVDLTAANTLILMVSSLTMILALKACRSDQKRKTAAFLTATTLLGSIFLGVQAYEYQQLLFVHHYPPGVSASGHFTPDVSLFASCFFTMTGFHGLHVAGGLVAIGILTLRSWFGAYSSRNPHSLEVISLYWHFVDLVWLILFAVVYLV